MADLAKYRHVRFSGCVHPGAIVALDGSGVAAHLGIELRWLSERTVCRAGDSSGHAYPTQEEAVQLSESASSMPLKEFLLGKIHIQGREVLLDGKQTNRMLVESGGDIFEPEKTGGMEIRAVPAGDDCILVRLQHKGPEEDMDMIYLFDNRTARPFARYEITGRGSHYLCFRSKASF